MRMRVFVESVLPCQASRAWEEVLKPSLLLEVVKPLARILPLEGEEFPQYWEEGQAILCRCWIFGGIPLGTRKIVFEKIDSGRKEIQTRESDALIRRWDHRIRVEPLADGRTRYCDEIEIDAGLLTPLVWLWTSFFYRHRQRRWRDLVAPRLSHA